MASTSSHLQQWRHNRSLIPAVPPSHPDWIVTVTFYTALHAVDALLSADKVPRVVDHSARNSVLGNTNKYQKIWKSYYPLYALSRTVRYLADPVGWIPFASVETVVFSRYLYPLERSVRGLLASRRVIQEDDMPLIEIRGLGGNR